MHVLERSVADGIKERLIRIEARPGREGARTGLLAKVGS